MVWPNNSHLQVTTNKRFFFIFRGHSKMIQDSHTSILHERHRVPQFESFISFAFDFFYLPFFIKTTVFSFIYLIQLFRVIYLSFLFLFLYLVKQRTRNSAKGAKSVFFKLFLFFSTKYLDTVKQLLEFISTFAF